MSFSYWSTYGYGIKVDDIPIKDITVEKLINLCSQNDFCFKNFKTDVVNFINTEKSGDYSYEEAIEKLEESDIANFLNSVEGDGCELGIGNYIRDVIYGNEKIWMDLASNFDGEVYLLLIPSFPWQHKSLAAKEKALTKPEMLNDILEKYIKILTDAKIRIDYEDVVNGG